MVLDIGSHAAERAGVIVGGLTADRSGHAARNGPVAPATCPPKARPAASTTMISADIQRPIPAVQDAKTDNQQQGKGNTADGALPAAVCAPAGHIRPRPPQGGSTPTRDNHALALMANTPVKNVSHRPMVHTAISTPSCVPRGGSTEIMYLNSQTSFPNLNSRSSRWESRNGT